MKVDKKTFEEREKEIKLKSLSFKMKIFFTLYILIIGFGYFWLIVEFTIITRNDPNTNNIVIIISWIFYFALLTVPTKFVWEFVYVTTGIKSIFFKWFIMFIAFLIPFIYTIFALIDVYRFRGKKIKEN